MSRKAGNLVRASDNAGTPPKRIDPAIRAVLLAAARRNFPKRTAAHLAGIGRETLRQWLKDDADVECQAFAVEFRQAMAEGAGELIDVVAHGNGKYPGDPKYLLGTVHKFKETSRTEVTGKDGGPMKVAAAMTDEEIEAHILSLGYVKALP